jgi:hypothetical protein
MLRMQLTNDDAAAIYARACRAWYGRRAMSVVTGRVQELRRRGDMSGVEAWGKVAAVLSQIKKTHSERANARGKLY